MKSAIIGNINVVDAGKFLMFLQGEDLVIFQGEEKTKLMELLIFEEYDE